MDERWKLEVRAWFTEWCREAQRTRVRLDQLVEIAREVARDVHVVAVGVGAKAAAAAQEAAEDGAGPARAFDTKGVEVPACRVCGCTWETIHDEDAAVAAGPTYLDMNVFVESDLCARCRDLGEDDETRQVELRLRAEAVLGYELKGQTFFNFVAPGVEGGAS